jgi:hypothetical protein
MQQKWTDVTEPHTPKYVPTITPYFINGDIDVGLLSKQTYILTSAFKNPPAGGRK